MIVLTEPAHPFWYRLAAWAKSAMLLPRSLTLRRVEIEGAGSCRGLDFQLLYIGEGESLNYLKHLCFSRIERETVFSLPIWRLSSGDLQPDASKAVIVVETHPLLMPRAGKQGARSFAWVRQKVDLESNDFRMRRSKIEAKCGRMARKYGHRYDTTQDEAAIERFYHEMYVPYIQYRFGKASHLRTKGEVLAVIRRGFLLQVYENKQVVSAMACRRRKGEITVFAVGLANIDTNPLQRGVLSSAYYFLFHWAVEHGLRTIDLLRSRANLYDGVFEHKRFWGARPEPDIWPHTEIRFLFATGQAIPSELAGQLAWKTNGLTPFQDA